MKKEKLYFTRYHDQWKGKDIELVEDEVNVYDLYIQAPDLEMEEGSINAITANFRMEDGVFIETVACEVYDSSKRMIKLQMPLYILANNGKYEVDFSVSYNKNGSNKTDEKTAIQTFTILDTIDITDEEIINDDRYDVLQKLIDGLADYKIDTSNFANKEEVQEMIDVATEGITIESIKSELEGTYVTPTQMNTALSNYVTKFDSAQFAKSSDLNGYAKTTWVDGQLSYYATNEKLKNYVSKENGKSLTSNDFTDELKEKLINIPEDGSNYDDTELRELIDKKASREFVIELFGDIQSIDLTKYYTIEEIIEIINNVNETHNTNVDNLENNVENTYLKKEDYEYMDGIHTDDVKINEEQNLTQFIEDLIYEEIEIEELKTTYITNIREYGETITYVAFEWKLNKTPISQTLTDCTSTLNNDVRNYYISRQYSENKTFTLTVTDGKVTKEKSITIEFVKPYLYGTFTEDNLLLDTLEDGNKIIDVKNNQTINLSYEDPSIFFAYPSSYGYLVDIKDNNGLSYFDDFESLIMFVNNENYNVYVLEEKATVSNISFSFIFEKEEE